MLMAYWIADQLGDESLPDYRRTALRAAVRATAPLLRGCAEALGAFTLALAVRRNGEIMAEAQRSEQQKVPAGRLLDALVEAHEDEAVGATVRQIGVHSPDVAAWLEEMERRGRSELRKALRACATSTNGGSEFDRDHAMKRLLAVVQFGTEPLSRRNPKPTAR